MLVYKIFRRSEWDVFVAEGQSAGAPIDLIDGYIHMSTSQQVVETAAKHFAGESDLVLVAIETDRLGPALKWEPSRGGALFPHLFAPLDLKAVTRSWPLPLDDEGNHVFPAEIGA